MEPIAGERCPTKRLIHCARMAWRARRYTVASIQVQAPFRLGCTSWIGDTIGDRGRKGRELPGGGRAQVANGQSLLPSITHAPLDVLLHPNPHPPVARLTN
jgi:hypothetical protein